jgi:hypothetical protein
MPEIGFTGVLLIILSTTLLDADHYFYYIFKKRDLSLPKAYRLFRNNNKKFKAMPIKKRAQYYGCWCFFHGIEILIIFLFLTFAISEYFGFVFIGVAFHLILDYAEQWPFYGRKDKISAMSDFLKFKRLRYIN